MTRYCRCVILWIYYKNCYKNATTNTNGPVTADHHGDCVCRNNKVRIVSSSLLLLFSLIPLGYEGRKSVRKTICGARELVIFGKTHELDRCCCDDGLGGMFADLGVAATLDCYVTAIRNNDDDDNNNPTAISHRNRRCRCVNFPPPRIHRRHVILFRRSEGETRTKTICGAGSSYVNEIN